jgi:dUTP pyrophosphatase
MTALTRAELRALLAGDPPLADGLADPASQLQPNGLDLTLEAIWTLDGPAHLGRDERVLPERSHVGFGTEGWAQLAPGCYLVRFAEALHLPRDLLALGRPRSTLARAGVDLVLAVWDAGYRGRSEALLVVHNPAGFRVQRGARLAQLVFFRTASPTDAYVGAYQGEHLNERR